MLNIFKRRSQAEIDQSIYLEHDYTGGYRFLPWLLYRRPGTGLIVGFILALLWRSGHWIITAIIIITTILLFVWLKRIFTRMKKGYRRW